MLFSGITFMYFFLPFAALYFLIPKSWRNVFLLIISLIFYCFGEPVYVSLLLFSSIVDWIHGLIIEKFRGTKIAKGALVSSIVINLSLLGFFKYTDFFITNINSLFSTEIPLMNIALPIGISFFTFQTMSYTIDVYRGNAKVQPNLSTFMTYVCLFPQLIAGPIVRYKDVEKELKNRECRIENVADGVLRFCVGMGKKVMIANLLGEFCANFAASNEKTVLFYWMNVIAFALQIYFDFSGYSDMAIGLGKMFGFKFPENFNYPFISNSITEFWRRWHMTLGSWFRDYVYIPLGGNRVSKLKWVRNIAVVWLLTGFWHGAQWNFVLWGAMFGVFLAIEKLWLGSFFGKVPKAFGYIYTLFVVVLSFAVFNANGLTGVINDFKGMFGGLDIPLWNRDTLYNISSYAIVFVVAVFGATPLPKMLWQKYTGRIGFLLEPILAVAILVASTALIINGSFNPFLYFRF